MSNAYFQEFGKTKVDKQSMREWLQPKFQRNVDGSPIYMTEQNHKDQCDVNKIIKKYDKNGIISHVSSMKAEFGDCPAVEYKEMQDRLVKMQGEFNKLPASIKKRFGNNPFSLIAFMDDAGNRDEAIKLGMIRSSWTDESDGMGEHVKKGGNVEKPPEEIPKT